MDSRANELLRQVWPNSLLSGLYASPSSLEQWSRCLSENFRVAIVESVTISICAVGLSGIYLWHSHLLILALIKGMAIILALQPTHKLVGND